MSAEPPGEESEGSGDDIDKEQSKKFFSLARTLHESGLDPIDPLMYTDEVINKHLTKSMVLNWNNIAPMPSDGGDDNSDDVSNKKDTT